MSEAVLSPGRRFFLALVMIFSPMAAPVFANSYGLFNAKFSDLPLIGTIVFGSLVLALTAAFVVEPNGPSAAANHLTKILFANVIFIFFDVAIFAVLVYGRHYSGHECFASSCETYPMGWLAVAGMHFCYVALGCFIKIRWS
jgi:hypothetical protein